MDLNDLAAQLLAERPNLFSAATMAIPAADLAKMAEFIAAVEDVVRLPAYRQHVLAWAPEIAGHEPRASGVFFGYDFHLTPAGPRLIEINTNAGGALLAAAQTGVGALEETFLAMFQAECDVPLTTVAIVDERPEEQYLYPEFLLCQAMLERHGVKAIVCDPADMMLCHGGLWHEETRIDLVYNRLTDFALAAPANAALRQAYIDGAVVVSPHPRAHALYADKRNLVALCDARLLSEWLVDEGTIAVLTGTIPPTESVTLARAEDLWGRRRQLFFKPAGGYGARAAYRGDKITRRAFDEVLAGNYVAQALVPPSTVATTVDGATIDLKADIRCYAYRGRIQLVAARLWQGQTTNFRTPGGGFARVTTA